MKIHLVVVVGVADQLIWSGWGDHKAASGCGAVPRRIQPHKQCANEIGVVSGCHWTYIPSLSGDWASPWKRPLAWSWWKRSTKLDQTSNFHGRIWALSGRLYIYIILFFCFFCFLQNSSFYSLEVWIPAKLQAPDHHRQYNPLNHTQFGLVL